MKFFSKLAAVAAIAAFSTTAFAHPIAKPGTEGLAVIASGGKVTATYLGTTAAYSNDLHLDLFGNGVIFNNHTTAVGSIFDLGYFAAGTELIFRLHVNYTGNNFFTGSASRNPDGLAHARVQENWKPGTTLVSFEDLRGLPEGIYGYNDLSFSFTNTQTSSVPESSPFALMLAGLGLLVVARRKTAA